MLTPIVVFSISRSEHSGQRNGEFVKCINDHFYEGIDTLHSETITPSTPTILVQPGEIFFEIY
jgi:hypothetical protein